VDEHDGGVVWNLRERRAHGGGARLAARNGGDDLPAAELFGEEDHRLLPVRRGGDDDRVDPLRGFQALEALRQQRPVVELRERLRPVQPKPIAAARRDDHGPHRHQVLRRALRRAMRRRRP
jgi:hypothetical protein